MNIQPIIDFDRSLLLMLNGSDNLFYDNLMAVLTSGLTWIPLYLALLVAVIKNNEKVMQILLVVGCALLCVVLADGGADFLAKPFFQRWRPSNDPMIKHMVHVVNGVRGGDYGFFSAHAANTFSLALFFSLLIRNRLLTFVMVFAQLFHTHLSWHALSWRHPCRPYVGRSKRHCGLHCISKSLLPHVSKNQIRVFAVLVHRLWSCRCRQCGDSVCVHSPLRGAQSTRIKGRYGIERNIRKKWKQNKYILQTITMSSLTSE